MYDIPSILNLGLGGFLFVQIISGGMSMTTTVLTSLNVTQVIEKATANLSLEIETYKEKCLRNINESMGDDATYDLLIKNALENIDEANPDWTYAASRLYIDQLYKEAAHNRGYDADETYTHFHRLIELLSKQ